MSPISIDSLEIKREITIAAPLDIAFEAVLDQLGPMGEMPGGKPFPMILEPWPGGRWYRALNERNESGQAGHLWGHAQVIKPPALLEIYGPLMMSHPAINHLQYRLTAEGDETHLTLLHRAIGAIPAEHREGLAQGWGYWLDRIRHLAAGKMSEPQ